MADEEKKPRNNAGSTLATPQAPPGQVAVPLITAGMTTQYSNFFRVTGTAEEMLLDFGMLSGVMNGNQPEPVTLENRIVLSFPTAKRLVQFIATALQRHEQIFGPIETEPQRRAKPQS